MKEVILDTETTGLSVKDGHRIVEIGCIEIENYLPTNKIFHYYLNPQRKVSQKALEVHGYTDDFLADKKKFSEIAEEFLDFINGKRIIIHNAEFDISHLNHELELAGKNKIDIKNTLDTLEIARDKFPGSGVSLDALCKRFRIDNSKRDKHTALIDCELLYKVYINLFNQKEPSLDFNEATEKKLNFNNLKNMGYFKGIVIPSAEELELHKNFIKNSLKKNNF
jgi:DNA polymerase-3 subunit epsilon